MGLAWLRTNEFLLIGFLSREGAQGLRGRVLPRHPHDDPGDALHGADARGGDRVRVLPARARHPAHLLHGLARAGRAVRAAVPEPALAEVPAR